jgi:hypothetical protein
MGVRTESPYHLGDVGFTLFVQFGEALLVELCAEAVDEPFLRELTNPWVFLRVPVGLTPLNSFP